LPGDPLPRAALALALGFDVLPFQGNRQFKVSQDPLVRAALALAQGFVLFLFSSKRQVSYLAERVRLPP